MLTAESFTTLIRLHDPIRKYLDELSTMLERGNPELLSTWTLYRAPIGWLPTPPPRDDWERRDADVREKKLSFKVFTKNVMGYHREVFWTEPADTPRRPHPHAPFTVVEAADVPPEMRRPVPANPNTTWITSGMRGEPDDGVVYDYFPDSSPSEAAAQSPHDLMGLRDGGGAGGIEPPRDLMGLGDGGGGGEPALL